MATRQLVGTTRDTIQRHPDPSARDPDVDPVVFDGGDNEIDHESLALRHEFIRIYKSAFLYRRYYNGGKVDVDWVVAVLEGVDSKDKHASGKISPTWAAFHLHRSQAAELLDFVMKDAAGFEGQFWKTVTASNFDQAIVALMELAEEDATAQEYGKLILDFDYDTEGDPPGVRPKLLKPSTLEASSGALWNPDKGTAVFVSRALINPREILAAVLFECGNAARQGRYAKADEDYAGADKAQQKAAVKAKIEFEVDRENQKDLQRAHGVDDAASLCDALEVPNHLRVQAVHVKGTALQMPPRTVLRNQEQRSALWWLMVDDWTEAERKDVWLATNHNELLGATGGLY